MTSAAYKTGMSLRDAIDHALVRIGATQGVDEAAVRSALDGLPPAGPLNHLLAATAAVLPLLRGDGELVSAAMDFHLDTLWFGGLAACIQHNPMLQDEAAPPPADPPGGGLDLQYYPEEAREAFDQGLLLKAESASADLILLWKKADRIAVMHAHPEGFWEIAPDPAAWITLLADAMETGQSRGLVRFRIRRFVEASGAERFSVVSADPALVAAVETGDLDDWLALPGATRSHQGVSVGDARIDITDDLLPTQISPEPILSALAQGRAVWLDVSLRERARWRQHEPPQDIVSDSVAAIKRQLKKLTSRSMAKTFALQIGAQRWTGLNPPRLLRQAAAISAGRRQGQAAVVTAERAARPGAAPERQRL